MGKRKKYTEEFKREAVQLMMTRGDRTIADVATSLGVAENLLHSWKRTYADTAEAVRKARGETPEDERQGDLKKCSGLLREAELSVFEFIHAEKAQFDVSELPRNLNVSRSGYYK